MKLVDLYITKQPFTPLPTHPYGPFLPAANHSHGRNPNINSALITAVLTNIFTPANDRVLKHWRTFEREGIPDKWFCWYNVLTVGYHNKIVNESWHCRCKTLFNGVAPVGYDPGCVWVRKDGRTGLLSFVWKEVIEDMMKRERRREMG